jgi:hypothetical protein
MTDSIYSWSTTAGDNASADAAIDWAEGQDPGTVNNSARAMMGRLKEFVDDLGGVSGSGALASTNVGNAYSVTANSAFSALAHGLIVTFKASATCVIGGSAASLSVNSLSSKKIRRLADNGSDISISAGQIVSGQVYTCRYSTLADTGTGGWMLLNPSPTGFVELRNFTDAPTIPTDQGLVVVDGALKFKSDDTPTYKAVDSFASGTRMMFDQAAAPTGWTQDTSLNDRVLRVVNGDAADGGSSGGSWTISGLTVGDTTLTVNQMPAHIHGVSDPGHKHTVRIPAVGNSNVGTAESLVRAETEGSDRVYTNAAQSATTGISINSNGGGAAHTHTLTANGNWRPAYRNIIIAEKD